VARTTPSLQTNPIVVVPLSSLSLTISIPHRKNEKIS
jgi:hypothetical protein